MRKRIAAGALTAVMAAALFGASGASAATEVGSNCTPNGAEEALTLMQISQVGPLPTAIPAAGVISQWRTSFPTGGEPLPPNLFTAKLKVFRALGGPGLFQIVGESSAGGLLSGTNTFLTRIPVQAGDRIGLVGSPITLYCTTGNPSDVFGYSEFLSSSVGGTQQFELDSGLQVPVLAVVEPDVDGDGYGDETQDKCPQSAAYQVPCPIVTITAVSSKPGKGAVTVLAATSLNAPVTVKGTVKLGKGKQAKLSVPGQTLTAGTITRFKLNFTGPLKTRLKEMKPSQSLQLNITADATNVAGQVSTTTAKAKLKGQG
ncbi:MAG TPA: hypothetical protein VF081_06540 [Solirubrobacterales bacterium]